VSRAASTETPTPAAPGVPIIVDCKARFEAIALPEPDGGFSVLIPALGLATQADTIEEARDNAVEVVEAVLALRHDKAKAEAIAVARGEA